METIKNRCFRLGMILSCGLWIACSDPYTSYDPAGFEQLIRSDSTIRLIDVRTPEEYAAGAIPGAVNIDVKQSDFLLRIDSLTDPAYPVAVYCKGGVRSRQAADALVKKGYTVYNLDKGYDSWVRYKEKADSENP